MLIKTGYPNLHCYGVWEEDGKTEFYDDGKIEFYADGKMEFYVHVLQ